MLWQECITGAPDRNQSRIRAGQIWRCDHRTDFAVSAPEVVLAAIAGRTSRIRLGSSATVPSSDDPVRIFQRFDKWGLLC
jgi:alkanesulfonate monooxygenase SsuD/methylene tetrahydromethanopterin reductase-like flavin-dependent oxidoreductase (luciferase family)